MTAETPAKRRARLIRYRVVFAERYGRGPEHLSEALRKDRA